MENLKSASTDYLLGRSLIETHKVSTELLSDIELWKVELRFFQKLMDLYSVNCETVDQKKELSHFQNLLIYYDGELLDQYRQRIRRHDKFLAEILDHRANGTEEEYRVEQTELENDLEAFIREFRNYKKEFYSFLEKLMD